MSFDQNDPRWTAYVLGELDPADKEQLEAILTQDADAREFVESLREATALLTRELASESPVALSDIERKRIEVAAAPKRKRGLWIGGSAIAALAAGFVGVVLFGTQGDQSVSAVASGESDHRLPRLAQNYGSASGEGGDMGAPSPKRQETGQYAMKNKPNGRAERRGRAIDDARRSGVLGGVRGGESYKSIAASALRADGVVRPPSPPPAADPEQLSREAYDHVKANAFVAVEADPRSTFSIDVDTASYANMRRFITAGRLPAKGAVRIEEMINYFSYDYPQPATDAPFSATTEVAAAPWARNHKLVRIGLKGKEIRSSHRPRSNLVFLLDVSGSMNSPNKLPLLKQAMAMLIDNLNSEDRIAIVVYAGASGLALPSTPVSQKRRILGAMDTLRAGGSTNGGAGIELAYQIAAENFVKGGTNRIILATDGDFNVGTSSQSELVGLVKRKAKQGVFLTVLGFGMGNYNDSTLEKIADNGNGNYAYIDTVNEARKVLVHDINATLVTIAKDVKIQIEFNPARVGHYRLVGYENRVLAHQDFNNDAKDAGDIGAGHTVTAIYEIVPPGVAVSGSVDALKYQKNRAPNAAAASQELLNIKLRYKKPDGNKSRLLEFAVLDREASMDSSSQDFKFAAAVAGFGMLLRDSEDRGEVTFEMVLDLAENGLGKDVFGYRKEFLALVRRARQLK